MFMLLYIVGYAVTASKRILTLLNEDELIEYRDTVQVQPDRDGDGDGGEGGMHSVIVLKETSFGWLKELSEEEKEKEKEKGGTKKEAVPVSDKKESGNIIDISKIDEVETAERNEAENPEDVGPNRSIYTLNQISFNALKGELVNNF